MAPAHRTMTRAKHSALATDVPVYALGFLDNAHVAYTGGGGAGRSGIANAIVRAPSAPLC